MDDLNTLIFRTDRIGDYIISCPFIISYKKKYPKSKIVIISSEYNYEYIKNFNFINKIISLKSKKKFYSKLIYLITLILSLRKNKYERIIILDGKKRSFFVSMFLKGKKFILLQSSGLKFLSKIINYNYVINYEIQQQYKNIVFLANKIGFNINDKEINIYKNYNFSSRYKIKDNNLLIHLDEKWFKKYYYFDYTDLNPKKASLDTFINKILSATNYKFDLTITTGSKKLELFDTFLIGFNKINDNFYQKKISNITLNFIKNTSFNELETIIKNSSLLICCEGGVSHVSHNLNIKTIAFYQYNRLQHTNFWTGHMSKLDLYPRKLMEEINLDKNFFDLIERKLSIK